MTTNLKKWGNSIAVRIPAGILQAARLHLNQVVEIREESGCIIIGAARKFQLNELLDAMDVNHLPELLDWGPPVGKEVW